jgi:chemotaxis protein CheC
MHQSNLTDPLQEVAAIAAGNAATSLAKLTGQSVTPAVPTVRLVTVENILKEIGDATRLLSVVVIEIQGDMNGLLVFSLDPDQAKVVVKDTAQQQAVSVDASQDQAVLCEMANIIAGTVLTAIGTFLDLRLMQSVPVGTTDMMGAALDPFVAEFGAKFDKVLVQQEVFAISSQSASLNLLAIIDPPSTNLMLQKVNKKVDVHANN